MKFICLGYLDENNWNAKSESERASFIEQCLYYDDELRRYGHFLGGEALQSARHTATVHFRNGHVSVTYGPFAETKEQIGDILILEARDLNHAIQLNSNHPCIHAGVFEIRPSNPDMNALAARQ